MIGLGFLIISSVIGAGFATGAELVAFFGARNISPLMASFSVSVFILLLSALILWIEKSKKDDKTPIYFRVIYFIFFCAMTAGIFELAGWFGAALSLVLCISIVLFGFDKVVLINKYLIFFILAVLFTVDLTNMGEVPSIDISSPLTAFSWALLYAGMNVCLLGTLFKTALKKYSARKIFVSCSLAAKIIGSLVFLTLSAIYSNEAQGHAMPVLALSNNFITYTAIFLSIFTSQVISLFNLSVGKEKTPRVSHLALFCALGFFSIFIGFNHIVGIFYPAVGMFMIFYVICCLILQIARHRTQHQEKQRASRPLSVAQPPSRHP